MGLRGIGGLVEGEDVVCGFEFRYGYEADLGRVRDVGWGFLVGLRDWGGRTCFPPLLTALMREVMLAMFSASCFARWGFICMSSAMVGTGL
ncbi:pyridoxal phosphate binding protein [Alternaria alternata]|nr:pyridoxal phosphate binding protein [Alternaria alternata]